MLSLDRPRKRRKPTGGVVVTASTSHFGGALDGGPPPLSPMAMATRPRDWTEQQAQMIWGRAAALERRLRMRSG